MASTLIQFRIEKDEKQRSSQILETMGLSLPAYLRICMIRLNKEKGIPFSMKLDDRIPEEGTGIELPSKYILRRCFFVRQYEYFF